MKELEMVNLRTSFKFLTAIFLSMTISGLLFGSSSVGPEHDYGETGEYTTYHGFSSGSGLSRMPVGLGLQYSSNNGNGDAGNWSLDGVTYIRPATNKPDDLIQLNGTTGEPEAYHNKYEFVISGNGAHGSIAIPLTYRGQHGNLAKYTPEYSGSDTAYLHDVENDAWRIASPGGTVGHYDYRVEHPELGTFMWVIRRIEDADGNGADFTYAKDPISSWPHLVKVEHGGNFKKGLAHTTEIEVTYDESRPDVVSQTKGDLDFSLSWRVWKVTTRVFGQLFRESVINYSSASGPSSVESIADFGSDAGTSGAIDLPDRTFSYNTDGLLNTEDNGMGGVIGITYEEKTVGTEKFNVVSFMEFNDGLEAPTSVTYHYFDGEHDPVDGSFAGFTRYGAMGSEGFSSITHAHGAVPAEMKGVPYQSKTYNTVGKIVGETNANVKIHDPEGDSFAYVSDVATTVYSMEDDEEELTALERVFLNADGNVERTESLGLVEGLNLTDFSATIVNQDNVVATDYVWVQEKNPNDLFKDFLTTDILKEMLVTRDPNGANDLLDRVVVEYDADEDSDDYLRVNKLMALRFADDGTQVMQDVFQVTQRNEFGDVIGTKNIFNKESLVIEDENDPYKLLPKGSVYDPDGVNLPGPTPKYNMFGQVVAATNVLGVETRVELDAWSRPISSSFVPAGETAPIKISDTIYTEGGIEDDLTFNSVEQISYVNSPTGVSSYFYFDGFGGVAQVRTPSSSKDPKVQGPNFRIVPRGFNAITGLLDWFGQMKFSTGHLYTNNEDSEHKTDYSVRDANLRVTQVTPPLSINPDAPTAPSYVDHEVDGNFRHSRVIGPDGVQVDTYLNEDLQVERQVISDPATGESTDVFTVTYDERGRPTSVTDTRKHTSTVQYNQNDEVTVYYTPHGRLTTLIERDHFGRTTKVIMRNQHGEDKYVRTYVRDENELLDQIIYSGKDKTDMVTEFERDEYLRTTGIKYTGGGVRFFYNKNGSTVATEQEFESIGTTFRTEITRDKFERPVSVIYPDIDASEIEVERNIEGLLHCLKGKSGVFGDDATLLEIGGYDHEYKLIGNTMFGDKVYQNYTYDEATGAPLERVVGNMSGEIHTHVTYARDVNGDLTNLVDHKPGKVNGSMLNIKRNFLSQPTEYTRIDEDRDRMTVNFAYSQEEATRHLPIEVGESPVSHRSYTKNGVPSSEDPNPTFVKVAMGQDKDNPRERIVNEYDYEDGEMIHRLAQKTDGKETHIFDAMGNLAKILREDGTVRFAFNYDYKGMRTEKTLIEPSSEHGGYGLKRYTAYVSKFFHLHFQKKDDQKPEVVEQILVFWKGRVIYSFVNLVTAPLDLLEKIFGSNPNEEPPVQTGIQ